MTVQFLKETLKGQDTILWLGHVPAFSSQVKQLTVFVAHGKLQYFKQGLKFYNEILI